ncbi:hypothetical protein CI102_6841 [Trichoderma harzianum]|nr:hypothetical protein CI102_6841 [Trichoderma harzianum]
MSRRRRGAVRWQKAGAIERSWRCRWQKPERGFSSGPSVKVAESRFWHLDSWKRSGHLAEMHVRRWCIRKLASACTFLRREALARYRRVVGTLLGGGGQTLDWGDVLAGWPPKTRWRPSEASINQPESIKGCMHGWFDYAVSKSCIKLRVYEYYR